ncbi:hypothetical protein L1887_52087 [Cichorium endivia]|nr:hypothetical protein L1887_52087 [Cichorium endivia]
MCAHGGAAWRWNVLYPPRMSLRAGAVNYWDSLLFQPGPALARPPALPPTAVQRAVATRRDTRARRSPALGIHDHDHDAAPRICMGLGSSRRAPGGAGAGYRGPQSSSSASAGLGRAGRPAGDPCKRLTGLKAWRPGPGGPRGTRPWRPPSPPPSRPATVQGVNTFLTLDGRHRPRHVRHSELVLGLSGCPLGVRSVSSLPHNSLSSECRGAAREALLPWPPRPATPSLTNYNACDSNLEGGRRGKCELASGLAYDYHPAGPGPSLAPPGWPLWRRDHGRWPRRRRLDPPRRAEPRHAPFRGISFVRPLRPPPRRATPRRQSAVTHRVDNNPNPLDSPCLHVQSSPRRGGVAKTSLLSPAAAPPRPPSPNTDYAAASNYRSILERLAGPNWASGGLSPITGEWSAGRFGLLIGGAGPGRPGPLRRRRRLALYPPNTDFLTRSVPRARAQPGDRPNPPPPPPRRIHQSCGSAEPDPNKRVGSHTSSSLRLAGLLIDCTYRLIAHSTLLARAGSREEAGRRAAAPPTGLTSSSSTSLGGKWRYTVNKDNLAQPGRSSAPQDGPGGLVL